MYSPKVRKTKFFVVIVTSLSLKTETIIWSSLSTY